MFKANVVSIGENAISDTEPIIILFGENSVTDNLEKVSVVQRFENVQSADITINNEIKIDDQVYTVKFKGDLVDSNFSMLGHVTLYFTEVSIYLLKKCHPSTLVLQLNIKLTGC